MHTIDKKLISHEEDEWLVLKSPHLTMPNRGEKWGKGKLIGVPSTTRYNGGITINDKWYKGIKVLPYTVEKGFRVTSIYACNSNARPSENTFLIEKI